MPRLFIAVDLPVPVKKILSEIKQEFTGARWVGSNELHLTLRFLGDADDNQFAALKAALAPIRFAPFPLTLCGLGRFPPGRHPHVLWVGMESSLPLAHLQQQVERAAIEAGFPPEERPFSPHITLARLKEPPSGAVERFVARHGGLTFPGFPVEEFVLYSSVLTRQGAIHTKEAIHRGG